MGMETQIFFFRIEKNPYVYKETSLGLLQHHPCEPHIHYRMQIWRDIFCSVICEVHSDYGDGTDDVAVVIATFSFSYTSFFSCRKKYSCTDADFQGRVTLFYLQAVISTEFCSLKAERAYDDAYR